MRFVFALPLLACATMTVLAQTPVAKAAYESDPKYLHAIKDANDALRDRQYFFVIDAYKKANKVAGGQCDSCLAKVYEWQMKLGKYKDAAETAVERMATAKTPLDRSAAKAEQAAAVLQQAGEKPKPEKLEAVHALYQEAIVEYPKNLAARYSDACVLARQGKMGDAGKEFAACAEEASPKDPLRVRAQHFAENPALSLSKMAPAFTVTALDGSKFTLDEMGGKVVLIDFWATWCGPCNEELPHMRKIAKEFAGQPLVIISVSWDADEAKWKEFMTRNEMTWVQYRDADHALSKRFGVDAIPHYFTIDSDGVLTAEMLGAGSDVEGKLKKLIARAKAAQGKETMAVGN